jgi:xylose isomerase
LSAEAILTDGTYEAFLKDRYQGWSESFGEWMMKEASLEDIAARVETGEIDPKPISGRQEMLENLINRYV